MSKQLKADLALLLVTIGWGSSFILTKNALADLQTYNFLAIRFIIAFVIPFMFFYKKIIKLDKKTMKLGVFLGVLLYLHYAFQTVGLNYTTASKSAFITGMNVIMVPIISAMFLKKMPKNSTIAGAVLACIGLGFLTLNGRMELNIGDIYTFICAVVFAVYIIAVGKFTINVDSISFAIIQIGTVGVLSLFTSLLIEDPIIPQGYGAWFNILFLALACTSGAYIIQNVAQNYTDATHTALIYTCEPVFAALFGYFIFDEILGMNGILGAVLIVSGMLLAEINFETLLKKKPCKKEEKSHKA